jgi:putative ATP-dependent endonuclease of the OLD family
MMHLSNLKLWNFRKYGSIGTFGPDNPDIDLNFSSGLNVLIGENDSGKSSIIDAIKLVLKTHSFDWIRVEEKDFYNDTNHLRIEITFDELSPEEAKNFTEWLGWTGTGEDAVPYLRVILDVKRNSEKIFPADVRAGVDTEGYILTSEAREYLKLTYLKPLRDAESELIAKKNSRLSQILIGDEAFKGKEKTHELVGIFNNLSEDLKKYFKGEFELPSSNGGDPARPQEGKKIKDKIDALIQSFYSADQESEFLATRSNIKPILEKLTLTLKNEENPGLGTLNRLFMAAELLHLGKENWTGIRLGLIEELEAHLHPQAQMQVIEAIQEQKEIQLILTTHSPNLASKVKLENLIICKDDKTFPLGSGNTTLDPSDYKFLERFLDTTKANLFFAKGVLLVEGWAEELLLPALAKKAGFDLTKRGVSVVNLASTAFLRYSKIFVRKLEADPKIPIPVAIIADLDVKPGDESVMTGGKTKKGAAIRKNQTAYDKDNVQSFTSPHWTLEYCLFKSTSLGATFQEIVKGIHTGTNWDDFESTLTEKLENKSLKKTEIADRLAQNLMDDSSNGQLITVDPEDETDTIHYIIKAIKHACGN